MQWPLIGREPDLDHAVELVEAGVGLALLGQAGVGKSRLLHELGDRAEESGKTVVRTVATESTRSIPFAPFVELISGGPTRDRLAVLAGVLGALRERNRGRGLLLTVDDAHHLDPSSLALLQQAVTSGAATVGMTARSGEQMAGELVDMWTNGVIERVDVSALTRQQLETLVGAALGPTEEGLTDELWRLSEGNPLVLHELLEGAVGASLIDDEGTWRTIGPLARSARLADLVRSRMSALEPSAVPAMEIAALGAPLPLGVAAAATGGHLKDLEGLGLIKISRQTDATVIVPAHPMYGEIMVENMPVTTRAEALRRLIEASMPHLDELDPIRVAMWQLDLGEVIAPQIAITGAGQALHRHDPALAENLVRSIDTDDPSVALLLGRALSYQQRWQEAEEVLSAIAGGTPELAGEVVSVRAQNLAFGLGRVEDGREVLGVAAAHQSDPELRSRLLNERAMISAISGDFGDARAATESVLSDPASGDIARVSAYVTLTVAQAMTGDSTGLFAVIPIALPMAEEAGVVLPFARDQIEIMRVTACLNAGRIFDAWEVTREAISLPERGEALLSTWYSAAGLVLDLAGSQPGASEYARRALEIYTRADPFGLEPQARGALALARGQLGDIDADEVLAGLPPHIPAPRLSAWVHRGMAWARVARGEIDDAVETLLRGGRHAVAGEHYAWASFCFHDVVRLGRPEAVIGDLEGLPEMPGALLIQALVDHARYLVAGDGDGVAAVARRLTGMRASLLAAEAWGQAAGLVDDEATAARRTLLSVSLERTYGEPVTPALATRAMLVSAREADMAMAAAEGLTSGEIAQSSYLSPRTVENHLQAVYRKCAIGGRDELREFLEPALDARIGFENE